MIGTHAFVNNSRTILINSTHAIIQKWYRMSELCFLLFSPRLMHGANPGRLRRISSPSRWREVLPNPWYSHGALILWVLCCRPDMPL